MAENDFEKTEPASARRREEARQEGNVARSTDLTAAAMLLAGVLLLYVLGMKMLGGMKMTVETMLRSDLTDNPTRAGDLGAMIGYGAYVAMQSALPVIIAMTAVGLLASVSQVGFRLTPEAMAPKFSKLSPIRGLSNMFNLRAAVRLGMSVGKMLVVFGVAAWVVIGDLPNIVMLAQLEAAGLFAASCQLVFGLALKIAVLLLVLALMDYAYQYYQREKDLRMSKQEVKEELKRMDGDPLIKQRRSRVARQLAMQRVSSAVPQADVIVTNPTHFAVALKYDPEKMRAPKVVAKGADHLAMRIRQLAALHGVPMVERKEVARALYSSVQVGQEVPAEYYNAIAEILAYVYRLSGRKTA